MIQKRQGIFLRKSAQQKENYITKQDYSQGELGAKLKDIFTKDLKPEQLIQTPYIPNELRIHIRRMEKFSQ